jgi:thiol-disulfide isomerase/thioredoxin
MRKTRNRKSSVSHPPKGCPACAQAVPILIELDNELDIDFRFYDTKNPIEKEKLLRIGVIPKHVPTLIIDCEVFEGVKTKEEYKNLIEERIK